MLILALATGATAEAVKVTLKSGGTMRGTLVGKSATEIKLETTYGVISLAEDKVAPESWTVAQAATPSNPSGKYVQPNPTKAPVRIQSNPHEIRIPIIPVDLIEGAYAKNPISADELLKGKKIAVSGIINNIGTSQWGRPFVRIGNSVVKYYSWGSEKSVAQLRVGQMITLTGTCEGLSGADRGNRIVIRE